MRPAFALLAPDEEVYPGQRQTRGRVHRPDDGNPTHRMPVICIGRVRGSGLSPREVLRFFSKFASLTNRPGPLQSFNCVFCAKYPSASLFPASSLTFFYGDGMA